MLRQEILLTRAQVTYWTAQMLCVVVGTDNQIRLCDEEVAITE
jgi:hypothetical protein